MLGFVCGWVLGNGGVLNRWCIYVPLVNPVYSIKVNILAHLRNHGFPVIDLNSCWIILLCPGYLSLPFWFLLHVIAKAVIQKQVVTNNGHELHNLNELEYINDEVWANVWQVTTLFLLVHQIQIALDNGIRVRVMLSRLASILLCESVKFIAHCRGKKN